MVSRGLTPTSSLKLLLLLTAVATFSAISYATTVSVTPTTYQSQYGIGFNVTGAFTATDQGFSVVPTTALASVQPCAWTNNTTCATALTQGHYEYSLQLTLNTVPAVVTTYTVTVKWDLGAGQTQLGQLTVLVPLTAATGQTMTFNMDTGSTTFTTPMSINVIVA